MSRAIERASKRAARTRNIRHAIRDGLVRAQGDNLYRSDDVATYILTDLRSAGYKIVSIPKTPDRSRTVTVGLLHRMGQVMEARGEVATIA